MESEGRPPSCSKEREAPFLVQLSGAGTTISFRDGPGPLTNAIDLCTSRNETNFCRTNHPRIRASWEITRPTGHASTCPARSPDSPLPSSKAAAARRSPCLPRPEAALAASCRASCGLCCARAPCQPSPVAPTPPSPV